MTADDLPRLAARVAEQLAADVADLAYGQRKQTMSAQRLLRSRDDNRLRARRIMFFH